MRFTPQFDHQVDHTHCPVSAFTRSKLKPTSGVTELFDPTLARSGGSEEGMAPFFTSRSTASEALKRVTRLTVTGHTMYPLITS